MKKLLDVSSLTYSSEFFSKQNSKFENWIIAFIGIFVGIFFVWLFFGRCEETVSGYGTVRPSENISSVHSLQSGKISKIYFSDGAEVKKGDMLFTLYADAEEASKNNLIDKIHTLEEKLFENDSMIKSFHARKNLLSEKNCVAYNRVKIFFEVEKQLKEICLIHEKNFQTQKKLPPDLIPEDAVMELERTWRNAAINVSQFGEKFLSALITEKESYEQQLENNKANLAQVEEQIKNKTVTAPIDGTILVLNKINENDFVVANETLLSIIPPRDLGYEIVVRVRERDIINLRVGLEAKLKLPAYAVQLQELKARVKKISADSLYNGKEVFYLVTLALDTDDPTFFNVQNKMKLTAGLQANAKIIVQEKNVFSYIVKKLEITL